MCSGNRGRQEHHAREEAKRQQAQIDEQARRKQEELDRQARERLAVAAAQRAQLQAMQREQLGQRDEQVAKVRELEGQQAARLKGIRSRGTAVSQSLRVLGQRATTQAPTAAMSASRSRSGGVRSTTASLRMGNTGRGTGSGSNVSV